MFTRTNSGLSAIAIFFNVEFLIYSEGSCRKDKKGARNTDGETDHDEEWSIDSVFWISIFKKFNPSIKVKIKSLGSKESVRPYAEKILSNQIENSLAALDRDFDTYRNEIMDHPKILYTHGYSWENDACRPELLISALNSIHPSGSIPDALKQEIHHTYKAFLKNINRIVYVDLLCGLVRIAGIDRDNYWALIDDSNRLEPKIKRDKFLQLIKEIKSRRSTALRYLGNLRIKPDQDCYGKLLSMFNYNLYCEYYKKITKCKSIPRHFADIAMAKSMNSNIDDYPQAVRSHYENTMARLQ